MAITTFNDSSTTAASNIDVNGTSIQGTAPVSNFDNALRELMAIYRRDLDNGVVASTKSANYTAVANDNNAILRFTGAYTLSLTAAATLGSRWHVFVVADGGDVIVDPNGAETINGAATITVPNGFSTRIWCTGSAFLTTEDWSNTQKNSGELYRGHKQGLTLSNNAVDATNDIDIATGSAGSDGTTPVLMTLSSAITKRLDAAWAVGSGNGGLDTGAIANGTYHVWLIRRSDTGVVDALFSASATSPTMPSGYDQKVRIGSILRESAAIVPFIQTGRNRFERKTAATDRASTSALASSLITLSVPTGINVRPILASALIGSGAAVHSIYNSAGSAAVGNADVVFQNIVGPAGVTTTDRTTIEGTFQTDTSARIYFSTVIDAGTVSSNALRTKGWYDDAL